jgi:hypothetical protein
METPGEKTMTTKGKEEKGKQHKKETRANTDTTRTEHNNPNVTQARQICLGA